MIKVLVNNGMPSTIVCNVWIELPWADSRRRGVSHADNKCETAAIRPARVSVFPVNCHFIDQRWTPTGIHMLLSQGLYAHAGNIVMPMKKWGRLYYLCDISFILLFSPVPPANIMFDRRVVRGNTYAAQVVPVEQEEGNTFQKSQSRNAMRDYENEIIEREASPEPVEGRRHMDVQTENYLEELTDKLPEVDEETQTEAFMDRPPSPKFIPTKTGIDKATIIEQGDLFDFDMEVEPILEVLVGKTLEQSMMEVLEEEELRNIRKHQEEFEQIRNAELAEVQRLEAEAKRRWEEKERRLQQERDRVVRERAVKEKVAARAFAKDYLTDLHANLFE